MIVLILLCRFAMASPGPELDLEFLIKDNVEMPKGINTPMCFCGDKCNLVRCTVLGYAYGMRFFMCANYAHDPITPFDRNLRAKVRTYYISRLFICHLCFIIC
jgi:hypothetical protein